MSKGNPFLALRLSPETVERLREVSARQGCTISDTAREALARGLSADEATTPAVSVVLQDLRRMSQRRSRSRKPSRIERASRATDELRNLLAEYTDWLASLPEFAEGSPTADKLESAVDSLETALGTLDELDLPRGFGRD